MSRFVFNDLVESDPAVGPGTQWVDYDKSDLPPSMHGDMYLLIGRNSRGYFIVGSDYDDDNEFPPIGPLENEEAVLVALKLL